jgi:putative ABC transport system substrate-binding protein
MPVIGFLSSRSAEESSPFVAAFNQGLSEAGYIDHRNVAIKYRWAEGRYDRLPALAGELVHDKVDLIATVGGDPSALAAKNATATIPIVFLAGRAIENGLVDRLARPSGNLTGFIILGGELGAKRLELLSELIPHAQAIALLVNPNSLRAEITVRDMQEAARARGVQLPIVKAGTLSEIDVAFDSVVQSRAGALVVGSDPFFDSHREQLVALASHHAIPAMYDWREFATAGGLISYGTSLTAGYRSAGVYAGKILKGAKPGDLPVQQPTKYELIINLKTAKTLGLSVPQSLLARADEVIE